MALFLPDAIVTAAADVNPAVTGTEIKSTTKPVDQRNLQVLTLVFQT